MADRKPPTLYQVNDAAGNPYAYVSAFDDAKEGWPGTAMYHQLDNNRVGIGSTLPDLRARWEQRGFTFTVIFKP